MERYLPDYGQPPVPDYGNGTPPGEPRRQHLAPEPPQDAGNLMEPITYMRLPEALANDPNRPSVQSIILSKAQRPDETVINQNSGIPLELQCSPSSLEATLTVRYGRATYEMLVSCNPPFPPATHSPVATNILKPLERIVRNDRGIPDVAENAEFRRLMDHLCEMVVVACLKWVSPIITNAKTYRCRLHLIEPLTGLQNDTLMPFDMSVWGDHRMYEELAEVVPNGRGYDVRFFKENETCRGFTLLYTDQGLPDLNWTNAVRR